MYIKNLEFKKLTTFNLNAKYLTKSELINYFNRKEIVKSFYVYNYTTYELIIGGGLLFINNDLVAVKYLDKSFNDDYFNDLYITLINEKFINKYKIIFSLFKKEILKNEVYNFNLLEISNNSKELEEKLFVKLNLPKIKNLKQLKLLENEIKNEIKNI